MRNYAKLYRKALQTKHLLDSLRAIVITLIMTDTPKSKNMSTDQNKETGDDVQKSSPWFVTPLSDGPGQSDGEKSGSSHGASAPGEASKVTPFPTTSLPSFEELASQPSTKPAAAARPAATAKPAATVSQVTPAPTQQPVSAAPKPVAAKPSPTKPSPKVDPSIRFDDDSANTEVSLPSLIIDGVAAAVAVIFTILIFKDSLPFL